MLTLTERRPPVRWTFSCATHWKPERRPSTSSVHRLCCRLTGSKRNFERWLPRTMPSSLTTSDYETGWHKWKQRQKHTTSIECRNKEGELGSKIREVQLELNLKLDELIKERLGEVPAVDKTAVIKKFLHVFTEMDDEYLALLQHSKVKVKNLHDFFYQIQPLHTNLPIHIKLQLEALTKNQLFLLLDVLCCYEPVMNFLNSKFTT
eukprot:NODE_4021_length_855_cov_31.461538_g3864_i0.p1 GENE.NODE_4021_length_855_cov_31.461538_g3864_i0~~NODE_4021_length_855_cov_31.461538_g3864_i0.p1  ORF type:complete len:206 (-),score=50.64 NODE_4021_length_855_cov_31.461538_g3864_i0:5-622(-)